jgi:hypothetical protein
MRYKEEERTMKIWHVNEWFRLFYNNYIPLSPRSISISNIILHWDELNKQGKIEITLAKLSRIWRWWSSSIHT